MSTCHQVAGSLSHRREWALPSVVIATLVGILYAPVLARLVQQWWQDPNYSHGFVVPLFFLFLLWSERDRWQHISAEPTTRWGIAGMIVAVGLLVLGALGAELFVSRLSFLVLLAGLVLFFVGWKLLRAWMFPLCFLLFMIPLPGIIYYQITFPLQLLASRFAETTLDLLQVPALREGNLIILPNDTLAVAEACSGIRSLFSLLAMAVAYGYIVEKNNWRRIALAVLMIPIAIVSNGFRIVGTALIAYFIGPAWAEGFFHFFAGWLIFVIALALMLLVHRAVGWRGYLVKEKS
jgi:exosortase